jgi:hypothetical protein
MDEDDSSSLSIPNETIDFDLVYSLHTFVATVEGQANVVKEDSLFLMDDSNSYWWLVRVLKTQEVGYIPAENIETPYERLARLNKHRNVDVSRFSSSYTSLTHLHSYSWLPLPPKNVLWIPSPFVFNSRQFSGSTVLQSRLIGVYPSIARPSFTIHRLYGMKKSKRAGRMTTTRATIPGTSTR